jgi:hypothetical protein
MNLPEGVGEYNMSQVEHNGIVAAEHIASAIGPRAGLPLCNDLLVTAPYVVLVFPWDDGGMDAAMMVGLQNIVAQPALLSIQRYDVGPKHWSQAAPDHPVQVETLNPIMLRQVSLESPEVL